MYLQLINYCNYLFTDNSQKIVVDDLVCVSNSQLSKNWLASSGGSDKDLKNFKNDDKFFYTDDKNAKRISFSARNFTLESKDNKINIIAKNTYKVEKFKRHLCKYSVRYNLLEYYSIKKMVAQGGFSSVYMAKDRVTRQTRAIKVTKLVPKIINSSAINFIANEVKI